MQCIPTIFRTATIFKTKDVKPILSKLSFLTDLSHDCNCRRMARQSSAAGPTSLEDYFQKGALLGQKADLNLWFVDTRANSKKLFPNIWRSVIFGLWIFLKSLCLFTWFNCLFSVVNIDLCIAAKTWIFTTEKGDLNYVNKEYKLI